MPKGPQVHKRRPRDPNQLGKLIVDISVGEVEDRAPAGPPRNEAAAELGRKGGVARAKAMTPERRAEIARKAALIVFGHSYSERVGTSETGAS
jgi:general stress protein YciG